MTRPVIIGTRGSELAMWQAEFARRSFKEAFPQKDFEIKIIRTTGDDMLDVALSKIGDKGLFTRQIESELLAGNIDIAVHSLKDLQTEQPAGLTIGAVCERELPNDALVSRDRMALADLPEGAKVATGSLRRKSQLLHLRPDLEIVDIRGNVPTRLRKFDESGIDGMILAYAGIHRLGLDERISEIIPTDMLLPAVGQGAVAIEIRDGDTRIAEIVGTLNHPDTRQCVTAERAFLRKLEGGCQVPIGAYATLEDGELTLSGVVGSLDGRTVFRETRRGDAEDADRLGTSLADELISKGAATVLTESRAEAAS